MRNSRVGGGQIYGLVAEGGLSIKGCVAATLRRIRVGGRSLRSTADRRKRARFAICPRRFPPQRKRVLVCRA